MTVDQFNRLPLLLRRNVVLKITGLEPEELRVMRENGRIQTTRLRREVRYFRESVREFVGLPAGERK